VQTLSTRQQLWNSGDRILQVVSGVLVAPQSHLSSKPIAKVKYLYQEILSMKTILVFTLSVAILLTGCSAAWISTVDSILAVAAPALNRHFTNRGCCQQSAAQQ